MAVTSIMTAEQLACVDQSESVLAEVLSNEFTEYRDLLVKRGNFDLEGWTAAVQTLTVRLREGWVDRELSEGEVSALAVDLGETVRRAGVWVAEARAVLKQAARKGVAGASSLLVSALNGPAEIDSLRLAMSDVARIRKLLSGVTDLSVYGFEADYLAQGLAHLAALTYYRDDQSGAQTGISVHATSVHNAVQALADKMEELNDAREVVILRTGVDLPGFDLRLVRAAAAPRFTPGLDVDAPPAATASPAAPSAELPNGL